MNWSTFWNDLVALYRESVIVQATLTLLSGAAVIYLYVNGQTPPDALLNLFWALMGIWVGQKQALGMGVKGKG